MENPVNTQSATPESVWAFLREFAERQKELAERQVETDRLIKEVGKHIGGMSKSHGDFAEEYFFNSFEQGKKTFFGEHFDDIQKNVPGMNRDFRDEYDILFINGTTAGIIEVKYKAQEDHIAKVLKKAVTFRENFPYYANHRIYLGLAALVFDKNLEQSCTDNGIAIIKQVGDTVVINDEHLKAF